jgi:hypothetical protein
MITRFEDRSFNVPARQPHNKSLQQTGAALRFSVVQSFLGGPGC